MKKLISLIAFGYMLCSVFVVDSVDARKRKKSSPPQTEVTNYSQNDFGSKKARKQANKLKKAKKNKKKFVEENSAEGYSDGGEEQSERKPGKNKAWPKKLKNKNRRRNIEDFDNNRNFVEGYSDGEEEQFERKPGKNKAWPKKLKNKNRRRNIEDFDNNRNFDDRYSSNEKDQFNRRSNNKFQNRDYQQEDEYSENDDNFDEGYLNNGEEQFKPRPINKNKRNPRYDSQDLDSTFQNPEPRDNFNGNHLSKKQLKKMKKRQKALEKKRKRPAAEIEQENMENNSDDWKNEVASKTSNTIEPVIDSKKINDSSIAVVSNKKMNKISAQSVLAQSEIVSVDKPSQILNQESIKTRLAKLSNFHKSCNLIRDPKPVMQLYSGTKEYREDLDRYRTAFLEKAKV